MADNRRRNREAQALLYRDLARAKDTHEVDMVLRLLRLLYEDIKDELVQASTDQASLLQGGARAYRDLIDKIERTSIALTNEKTENN
jgi:uncharacterized membrane-anchored protein YhcB (DUF1043 family)